MLVCAALIAGCSMARFGYSQADSIAAWMADSYFGLDDHQKSDFAARFARFYAWHRYDQLPDYVQFLSTLHRRAQQPLAREDAVWLVEGVKARYRTLVERGNDDAAEMLSALTAENIQALQRRWDRDNRRFVREHRLDGTPAERRRAAEQRLLRQISNWTGSLAPEQEERIIALSATLPEVQHLRHADRLRRQHEFLQLLELRADRRLFAQALRDWLIRWDRGRAPEYARLQAEAYEKRIAFYLAVDRMLTPRQRAAMLDRLQSYIDDFSRLSKRGGRVAEAR